jgi:hypothetical protein
MRMKQELLELSVQTLMGRITNATYYLTIKISQSTTYGMGIGRDFLFDIMDGSFDRVWREYRTRVSARVGLNELQMRMEQHLLEGTRSDKNPTV